MDWYWILLLIIGSLVGFLLLFSLGFSIGVVAYLSHPKHFDPAFCNKVEADKGLLNGQGSLPRQPMNFTMADGYQIHGDYIPAEHSRGLIIFTHGYTWCMEGALKYVFMSRPLGFDSYIYDVRGHGRNKSVATTMGHQEAKDLHEIIAYFRKQRGEDAIIGLQGESMGAATSLEVLKYGDKIDFIMEDSGYSSLKKELEFQLRKFPFLRPLLPLCSLLLKLFHGYWMKDVDALKAAKDYKGPLLILHGAADTFVPIDCADLIEENHQGYAEKHMFEGCDHTLAAGEKNEEYTKIVREFLSSKILSNS